MSYFQTLKKNFQDRASAVRLMDASAAYDLWAPTYDNQPANLLLRIEDRIFGRLIDKVEVRDRSVLDLGCGTGRHWPQILQRRPATLAGYDVSAEMLRLLQTKYPRAQARLLQNHSLPETERSSIDILTSTLVLAHIADLPAAFRGWDRVLKSNADILLTDFHPAALERGAERTFQYNRERIAIRNYVHTIPRIHDLLRDVHWKEIDFVEVKVDESLKHHYLEQDALAAYERLEGTPVIYGWLLRKS